MPIWRSRIILKAIVRISPMYQTYRTSSLTMQQSSTNLVFRQVILKYSGIKLFDSLSCTYTYLLGDKESKEAILIDPVLETVDRDLKTVSELGLKLKYGVNTHVHADHVTGTGQLKTRVATCQSILSEASKATADVKITEGDEIKLGGFVLECLSTPGHTDGCMSYVLHLRDRKEGMVFTGDTLMVRGCGRTDFQQGNAGNLYENVHKKIFTLPDNYFIYPAHDYKGQTRSTVGEEKEHNPRLTKTKEDFIKLMSELNLAYPKLIDKAVPANMVCGYV